MSFDDLMALEARVEALQLKLKDTTDAMNQTIKDFNTAMTVFNEYAEAQIQTNRNVFNALQSLIAHEGDAQCRLNQLSESLPTFPLT